MFQNLNRVFRIRNPHKEKTIKRTGMVIKPGQTIMVPPEVPDGEIAWMLRHKLIEDPDAPRKAELLTRMQAEVDELLANAEKELGDEVQDMSGEKPAGESTPESEGGSGKASSASEDATTSGTQKPAMAVGKGRRRARTQEK